MKYKNIVTGNIIDVPTEIKGKNWEKVTAKAGDKPAKAEPVAPKVVNSTEEVPVEKPKRGKKK